MRTLLTASITIFVSFLLSACSGSPGTVDNPEDTGTGGNGGDGGPDQPNEADVDADVGDEPIEGKWTCGENNRAIEIGTGYVWICGMDKCVEGIGCLGWDEPCESDDECIESTLEIGWEVDLAVHCKYGICQADKLPWSEDDDGPAPSP
ncbi:MAG: hypothetical protein FWD57_05190 [Polyangiaceae bacterium]|nr:hypothetical protein [Polyangiaceae bacterium]